MMAPEGRMKGFCMRQKILLQLHLFYRVCQATLLLLFESVALSTSSKFAQHTKLQAWIMRQLFRRS